MYVCVGWETASYFPGVCCERGFKTCFRLQHTLKQKEKRKKIGQIPQAPQYLEPTVERPFQSAPLKRVANGEGETERNRDKEEEI